MMCRFDNAGVFIIKSSNFEIIKLNPWQHQGEKKKKYE